MFILPILIAIAGITAIYVVSQKSDQLSTISEVNSSSNFITYDEYQSSLALYKDKRVIYFFHADWCVTCRALESDIAKNLGSIPADVVIVKTDYDTQNSLRQKYGVTTQHTLVQIRTNGEMVGKWVGQPSLSRVLENVQSV